MSDTVIPDNTILVIEMIPKSIDLVMSYIYIGSRKLNVKIDTSTSITVHKIYETIDPKIIYWRVY